MTRRASLPAALESAQVKLRRAKLHTSTGKREMMRFFGAHEDPTFRVETHRKPDNPTIGDEFTFRIVVEHAYYPALPDAFSARFGDAIHNYRCVLDHIAWQLVKHGSTPNPPDPFGVQFPIHSAVKKFRSNRARRLPGVAKDHVDFIRRAHAYEGGKATNETLLALARLSNDDKHRTIHPAISAFSGMQHQMRFTHCNPVEFKNPPTTPKLKPDAVIVYVTCVMTGHKPQVQMGLTPSVYIVLEDGRPMFKTLYEILEQVEAILYAPEIAAGLK